MTAATVRGMATEITDRIRAYHDGHGEPWTELRDWLGQRTYPAPARAGRAPILDRAQDDSVPYTDGTWDEVDRCHNVGLLTHAEFREILQMQWAKHGDIQHA